MPLQVKYPQDASETPRQVNSILQNLRGEHFRHSRNVQRSPASLITSLHVHNLPTLPTSLIYHSAGSGAAPEHHSARTIWVAGPDPPRSWTTPLKSRKIEKTDSTPDIRSRAWREHALDLVFSPSEEALCPLGRTSLQNIGLKGEFPTLALLCLHVIRVECSGYQFAEIMPYIPLHLRRALVRHSAINFPLSEVELNAVCGDEGHTDGELVIVGPHATLRNDHFRCIRPSRGSVPESTWDSLAAHGNEPSVLFSFTLLSTPLTLALSNLPPTITCLALINIPQPVSLQRIPSYCPLVSLLDLSYNSWLNTPTASGETLLEDYPWTKFHYLKILGLRGYHVTSTLLSQINRGRWDDVQVIH